MYVCELQTFVCEAVIGNGRKLKMARKTHSNTLYMYSVLKRHDEGEYQAMESNGFHELRSRDD